MRKIVYVCDRCGAEIDGDAAGIEIKQKDSKGYEDEADLIDVSALFADKAERSAVEGALSWDIRRTVEEHLGTENGGIPEE